VLRSYRSAYAAQSVWSFPVGYKGYRFDAPPPQTKAMMAAIDAAPLDVVMGLHDCSFYGGYFYVSDASPWRHAVEGYLRDAAEARVGERVADVTAAAGIRPVPIRAGVQMQLGALLASLAYARAAPAAAALDGASLSAPARSGYTSGTLCASETGVSGTRGAPRHHRAPAGRTSRQKGETSASG
jgi:hypothetical protein